MPLFKPDTNKLLERRDTSGLVKALRHKDRSIRLGSAEALRDLKDVNAVEPLIAALGDEDNIVRATVAEALGRLGDPRAVEPLIAALGDEDNIVRRHVTYALGEFGDARAVEPLIAALGDSEFDVRANAAEALGKLGDTRAIEPLVATFGAEEAVAGAPDALVEFGEEAVEPLIGALRDATTGPGRSEVARTLEELGDPRAVEPLIAALGDSEYEVRFNAAVALGGLGDARAVEPLIAVLTQTRVLPSDEDSRVRMRVTGALGRLGRRVQPRDLWAAGLGEVCDLCNGSISREGSHLVPYAEFRSAVSMGYDPFARGRAGPAEAVSEAFGVGSDDVDVFEAWKETVLANADDWGLCFDCARDLAAFLSTD